eukprot:gene7692-15744_t
MKAIRSTGKALHLRRVYVLAFILFANISSLWVPFTFLPFMIKDFSPSTPLHMIGLHFWFYSSSFSIGCLFSTMIWTYMEEKIGRRQSIIWCLMGSTCALCLLGLSPNFFISVIAQFLLGLFNCIINIIRSYTFRTSDHGLTSNGIVTGMGFCAGILIGGFCSKPTEFFPFFKGTIFEYFPFLLPCLLISCFNIFAIIFAHFELNDKKILRKNSSLNIQGSSSTSTEYSHLQSEDEDIDDIENTNKKRRILTEVLTEYDNTDNELDESQSPTSSNEILQLQTSPTRLEENNPNKLHISTNILNNNNITSNSNNNLNSISSPLGNRRVSFNSLVEVRVIGSAVQAYSKLKYVHPEDRPVLTNVTATHASTITNNTNTDSNTINEKAIVRYTNGSEFFQNDDSIEQPFESVRKMLLKEQLPSLNQFFSAKKDCSGIVSRRRLKFNRCTGIFLVALALYSKSIMTCRPEHGYL